MIEPNINLTPFFSLTSSAIFLDETIYLEQIIGFMFIISGVILGTGTLDNYLVKRKKGYSGKTKISDLHHRTIMKLM